METRQQCPTCKEWRPLGDYSPSNRGRAGTYCRPCRRDAYRKMRPQEPRPCATCGTMIENPFRSDVRFCSTNCRAADARRRRRAGEAAPPRRVPPPLYRTGEIITRACTQCSGQFTYTRIRRQRHLCDPCRYSKDGRRQGSVRYGMTTVEMTAYRAAITGCSICGVSTPGSRGFKGWHIDHDHETGKLRGALCGSCNIGIGHFRDNIELLLKAAEYLRGHTRSLTNA